MSERLTAIRGRLERLNDPMALSERRIETFLQHAPSDIQWLTKIVQAALLQAETDVTCRGRCMVGVALDVAAGPSGAAVQRFDVGGDGPDAA